MKMNVVAPSVGESITEVRILKWNKQNGAAVKAGEVLLEIETDKATVEVAAEAAGALSIAVGDGEMVKVGTVLGFVDTDAKGANASAPPAPPRTAAPTPAPTPAAAAPKAVPVSSGGGGGHVPISPMSLEMMGPSARRTASETNADLSRVQGSGRDGRITSGDIMDSISNATRAPQAAPAAATPSAPAAPRNDRPGDRRVGMTRLRQTIAERLVSAQRTAAILTTFNEVDMTNVMKIRNQHKDSFKSKHGVALSFMSFFAKACVAGLKAIPGVNASLDGTDVVYHDYYDIAVAVGTDRGLVVPVLRAVEKMSFLDIEKGIAALAEKARAGKLSIPDMTGGTFTISNGGTYGSLLSTPILNPPQSGILGMHKIQERPVAIDGKVEVRPMMYLALSYDHRLIDGKEAVTFLVTLKDHLENPEKLGLDFLN